MSTSAHQNLTENLADFTWESLSHVFSFKGKRPPVYFFLSPKSNGSLKKRSVYEIDLVHRQQFLGEGISLKSPPAAWVSEFWQIPEEVGHLFAITHQKSTQKILKKKRLILSLQQELWSMTLHECFGKLASHLALGLKDSWKKRPKSRIKSSQQIWEAAHQEGYYLAAKLAKAFFDEKIGLKELRMFFKFNWYSKKNPKALNFLYSILGEAAPTTDFKKIG